MASYSCNLSGACETNEVGIYRSLEECQARCQGSPLSGYEKEMAYIAISYDPEQALSLAPSDQVEYLRREFGIVSEPANAGKILLSLYSNDYLGLYRLGQVDYLHSRLPLHQPPRLLDPLDFFLMELLIHKDLILLNWDGTRYVVNIFLRDLFANIPPEEWDNDIDWVLNEVYHKIEYGIRDLYLVPVRQLEPDQNVPEFMYEYVEFLREKYVVE